MAHMELENAMLSSNWSGRRIFITGHTGFKGAWMTMLLNRLGAKVAGYALSPPSEPNLFTVAGVEELGQNWIADIRDAEKLTRCLGEFAPDVVLHMAAQSLVRESYRAPVETFDVNVLGTVQVLEAARKAPSVKAVIVLTSDKSYENRETLQPYRESDPMGGHDPYSASKGCAELATAAYGRSFFQPGMTAASIASVRAGNVVGGGDWATDRLIADIARGLIAGEDIVIRRPDAIRPWQHVLDALHGYLRVAEHLLDDGPLPWEAWNFGPDAESEKPVETVARMACELWGKPGALMLKPDSHELHEATLLKLDSSKARNLLGWKPRWDFAATIRHTMDWYRNFADGNDMRAYSIAQIDAYRNAEKRA
jgi:CDP-glucose 4,6-dehydratase